MIYLRKEQTYVEDEKYNTKSLHFLYHTILGRFLLKLITRPIFSKCAGLYYSTPISKRRIDRYARRHNIVLSKQRFKSFNAFFTREHPPLVSSEDNELIAVADSKLSVYQISEDLIIKVKNSVYSIPDLVENHALAQKYKDGFCLVFRLTPLDNHRYFAFDNYALLNNKKIKGILHSVNPISDKYEVFIRNAREVSTLQTQNFGEAVQVEVGALLVGKIKNHSSLVYRKGEERGFFEYGGSTIILLLNKNIKIDKDILIASANGCETKVTAGERIGTI